ncbi:MAG: DUF2786 domain-containing protein [Desulfomonile tiedjei]|nr:DUF2786 domain-containing protein [Desulfomonile tiedjei]
MTKDEVLAKVRKLFELANSPNENEAALAAAKARELLCRYNLSIADLPTDDMKTTIAATEKSVAAGKVIRNWVKGLLIHVAQGFECDHVIRRRHGSSPILTFIGTPADAEVAVYTFHFLYRQLDRLVDRALPALKRENRGWSTAALRYAYLDGAVKRIGERFQEQTRAVRAAEYRGCKELVLAKEQMIRDYMADAFPRIRTEYGKRRAVSVDAFEKGYGDAGAIRLRPAIADGDADRFAVTA